MHGLEAKVDRPYMPPKCCVVSSSQLLARSIIDPDCLADLAQSQMGILPSSSMLRELCWAVQAHCCARELCGRWDCVDVPELLSCWSGSYAPPDLAKMLELWIDLVRWMKDLELLPPRCCVDYLCETRAWLAHHAEHLTLFRDLCARLEGVKR